MTVPSVEMRDIIIPAALQDAMSREAQAAREKAARVILAQAEVEIAHQFDKASDSYRNNPTALHLRAMNMLYEGLKEKGALMLFRAAPSSRWAWEGCSAPRPCGRRILPADPSAHRSRSSATDRA